MREFRTFRFLVGTFFRGRNKIENVGMALTHQLAVLSKSRRIMNDQIGPQSSKPCRILDFVLNANHGSPAALFICETKFKICTKHGLIIREIS